MKQIDGSSTEFGVIPDDMLAGLAAFLLDVPKAKDPAEHQTKELIGRFTTAQAKLLAEVPTSQDMATVQPFIYQDTGEIAIIGGDDQTGKPFSVSPKQVAWTIAQSPFTVTPGLRDAEVSKNSLMGDITEEIKTDSAFVSVPEKKPRNKIFGRIAKVGAAVVTAAALIYGGISNFGNGSEEGKAVDNKVMTTTSMPKTPTTSVVKSNIIDDIPKAKGATRIKAPAIQTSAPQPEVIITIGVDGDNLENALQKAVAGQSDSRADKDEQVIQFTDVVLKMIASQRNQSIKDLNTVYRGESFRVALTPELVEMQKAIQDRFSLAA